MTSMASRVREYTNDMTLFEIPARLIDTVERALHLISPLLQVQNISVIKKYFVDVELIHDPVHLLETLNNIFTNAIEAMPLGGQLTIRINTAGKWLVLSVHDNGYGIPKEILPQVFHPFFSTKKRRLNFGLGLSYCYRVMKQHGGSIEIHSEEQKGTTVFLNFKGKGVKKRFFSTP